MQQLVVNVAATFSLHCALWWEHALTSSVFLQAAEAGVHKDLFGLT
jgi:hypothetical protein